MVQFSKALPFLVACALPAFAEPVINEILFRPGTSYPENTALEFVEIHNAGTSEVDLTGWALTDGVRYSFPGGTVIAPGGYLVVSGGSGNGLGPWQAGDTLSNSGESIVLSKPDGSGGLTKADEIRFADEGDWAVSTRNALGGWSWVSLASSAGHSTERRNPNLAVNNGQNWASSASPGGTPGAANSCLTANVAPVISKMKHSPAVPKSNEVVTISCELDDETPVNDIAATLYWRDASGLAPGFFQSIAMTNDGNGRFATTLGAKADKTIIEFYVQATDGTATRTWPALTSEGQNANCIYQVDNEVDSSVAATYRLVLTAAENAAYDNLAATNPQSDREFNMTFIADHGEETTIRYRSRMRIRGQSSRNFIYKPLRISFPGDDRWEGISDFSLNPKYPWVQFMGMRALQAAGLVAGDSVPVELRRNGVESSTGSGTNPDYGMWARIEAINGDYASRHYPEATDVQLYRKNSGDTEWSSLFTPPTNPDGTYSGWSKQSQSGRNDWSDVVNFSNVWQAVAAPYFPGATAGDVRTGTWNQGAFTDEEVATLSTVANLDEMARWLAVMTILNNTEHNISNGYDNDYGGAFVSDGTHRRLNLIPHDTDNLLGKGDSPKGATATGLFTMTDNTENFTPLLPLIGTSQVPGNAVFRQKYLTAIRELYGSVFDSDTSSKPNPPFHAWLDNHLGNWVPAATRTQMKTYMTVRQNYLLGLIGAGKITPPVGTSNAAFVHAPAGNLRINEVLAENISTHAVSGTFPDIIELHNTGPTNIGISNFTISDSTNSYTFPPGSGNVPAGGYRIIHSNTFGFGLSSKGDTVRLRNAADEVLDEITFGAQIADKSISRTTGDAWELTVPTIGEENGPGLTLGSADGIRLNEWAGNTRYRLSDDFVELYNPAAQPVALSGLRLTDDLASYPARHEFAPLTFMAPGSFLEIDSDIFGFGLNGHFETLWLLGNNGATIDQVDLISQHADTSSGRAPDGGITWADFTLPSPGISNGSTSTGYEDVLEGLRLTEIMYLPSGNLNGEFIEFQNIGTTPLQLGGVRMTSGVEYTFAPGVVLAPQDYIVICKDRPAFLNRYPGASAKLADGIFIGSLSDTGEKLTLTLPVPWELNILRFDYSASWYPLTAGAGRSLITRDQGVADPDNWGNSETWEASTVSNGSPGTGEPPVITSTNSVDGIIGDAFSYLITATRSPSSFGATGLPDGLSIDTVTGLISGSPTVSGVFPVQVSATNASATATLTLTLSVTPYGEFHHFTWNYVPPLAYAGKSFPARLTARDIGGRLIRNLQGNVPIKAAATSDAHLAGLTTLSSQIPSPILLTELTDEGEDQFELQNVSAQAFNTTGWFVVLGDSLTNVNTRNGTTFALPATMASGGLLRVSDSNTVGRTYFGSSIGWNHASTNPSRGWVMLFDASARLRDFVAFGWTATQLGTLSITVSGKTVAPIASGHWSGAGLVVGTRGMPGNTTDSWKRVGSSDGHTAADWSWAQYGTSWGVSNIGLTLPWEVVYPLTVTPATAAFTDGQFFGNLAVTEVASPVFLTAIDTAGHVGKSSHFQVLSSADLDHDGLPDAWEDPRGLFSTNPNDAAEDLDGDGQSNLDEFDAGTDPTLASSVFAITSGVLDAEEGFYSVEWSAVAGKTYHVFRSENLMNWSKQGTIFAEETGLQSFRVETGGLGGLFFRVTVDP